VASPGENRHNQRADRDYSRRSIRNRTNRRWRNATPVIFLSRSGPNKPLAFALTKLDADHPYFAERGLTADTIATFGLGFCNKGLLRGYAAIPIHNQAGDLIAYAGRWPGTPEEGKGKYKLPEGFKKSLELFNFHRAMSEPEETPLVIVEGFFDCMRLWQRGLRRVVALMGCSLSEAQEEILIEGTTQHTRVIVMLDEDEAGRAGRMNILERLAMKRFVRIFRFEQEGQQPETLTAEQLEELCTL
jgi:DNA primase